MLEVLISIFVLAVGLLGVAALIPAGRHEIAQGSRLEYASMIGRSAFRDLKVRGMLKPDTWRDGANALWVSAANPPVTYDNGATYTDHVAVVIDPLGVIAGYNNSFPHAATGADPQLRRISTMAFISAQVVDSVFRASVDLITEENANSNLPPTQVWFGSNLRRASDGNYSWLATIVSDPQKSALAGKVTVSVVVFHKRVVNTAGAGEYGPYVVAPSGNVAVGVGGGDLLISGLPTSKVIKPGDWIMLAAKRASVYDRFHWYRVVAASGATVTLAGADLAQDSIVIGNASAFVFDNIVAVYQKNMTLEAQ